MVSLRQLKRGRRGETVGKYRNRKEKRCRGPRDKLKTAYRLSLTNTGAERGIPYDLAMGAATRTKDAYWLHKSVLAETMELRILHNIVNSGGQSHRGIFFGEKFF